MTWLPALLGGVAALISLWIWWPKAEKELPPALTDRECLDDDEMIRTWETALGQERPIASVRKVASILKVDPGLLRPYDRLRDLKRGAPFDLDQVEELWHELSRCEAEATNFPRDSTLADVVAFLARHEPRQTTGPG